MSDHSLDLQDLTPYYRRADLVQATVDQLNKDLGEIDDHIDFSGSPDSAYDEVMDQLVPIVGELMDGNRHRFFQLVYRIDLDERRIRREFVQGEGDNPAGAIAHLILEREMKKVLIRRHFSQSSSAV